MNENQTLMNQNQNVNQNQKSIIGDSPFGF